jgi:hypothetical protein
LCLSSSSLLSSFLFILSLLCFDGLSICSCDLVAECSNLLSVY